MKITCLIDSLGPGGAQRQLSLLAVLLKKQGMDVKVLTYHPHDFFLPMLQNAGVGYECVQSSSKAKRVLALRRALRGGDQDVVLAFLDASCIYAELAGLPRRSWGLVVSERLATPESHKLRLPWKRWLHGLADYVTTNSHTNRLMIERSAPRLAGRVVTLYNAVDLELFRPAPEPNEDRGELRLVVAASYQQKKNMEGLATAVARARSRAPSLSVAVDWYGGFPQGRDGKPITAAYDAALDAIRGLGLENSFRLHPPSRDMVRIYQQADALVLASFFEGLPNAVCEGMACGLPILMSNVCDAGNLVEEGKNGFLFDPHAPEDMARAILALAELSREERRRLGENSRERAEYFFSPERFVANYLPVLAAAAERRHQPLQHWAPAVPPSVHQSLA